MWTWLEPMRASKLSYIRNPHLLTLTERVYGQSTEKRIQPVRIQYSRFQLKQLVWKLRDVEDVPGGFGNVVLCAVPKIF